VPAHFPRVQKFDSNGGYITQWGSFGPGAGQFDRPEGVAVDSDHNVYVADSDNNRIQKFDSNGNPLAQWGSYGSGDGQFFTPRAVAVDSDDNVYVVDMNNHRIQKFDSDGGYITQWGSEGSGDGQFKSPEGVAVDSDHNVYVADEYNHRIQKFCPALPGDTNQDCYVDENDFAELEAYLCEPADACPTCDLDEDGWITPDDAQLLVEANSQLKMYRRSTARLYRYYPDCGMVMLPADSPVEGRRTPTRTR